MKSLFWIGLVVCSLSSMPVMAQSDLDGTWRVDLSKSVFTTKPETFVLRNGRTNARVVALQLT